MCNGMSVRAVSCLPTAAAGGKKARKPGKKPLPSLMLVPEATTHAVPCGKGGAVNPPPHQGDWEASCVFEGTTGGRVYIGTASDATNESALRHHRVTHVVNVTPDCPAVTTAAEEGWCPPDLLRIPVKDHCDAPLRQHFLSAAEFMQKCMEQDGAVLVHCRSGISRSATVAAAFLMVVRGMSADAAFGMLRTRRPVVSPNIGFLLSLEAFQGEALTLHRALSTTSLPSTAIRIFAHRQQLRSSSSPASDFCSNSSEEAELFSLPSPAQEAHPAPSPFVSVCC